MRDPDALTNAPTLTPPELGGYLTLTTHRHRRMIDLKRIFHTLPNDASLDPTKILTPPQPLPKHDDAPSSRNARIKGDRSCEAEVDDRSNRRDDDLSGGRVIDHRSHFVGIDIGIEIGDQRGKIIIAAFIDCGDDREVVEFGRFEVVDIDECIGDQGGDGSDVVRHDSMIMHDEGERKVDSGSEGDFCLVCVSQHIEESIIVQD